MTAPEMAELADEAPFVVVGAGAAGMTAALELARTQRVLLVTKGSLGVGNSMHAQGGIAAAMSAPDSPQLHARDTVTAGAGVGDDEAIRILTEEGPQRVLDLVALGMPFDIEAGELAQGREAAHSIARVLHAGGDATGRALVATLSDAIRESTVEVIENAFVADLLVDDGAVTGIVLFIDGERQEHAASAVLIATGGAGQLFEHTTNPLGATGDGVAAAIRVGAPVADLEFYQFHPTALDVDGTPLISEAVRGAGAVLLDDAGERFMLAQHPDAELAPRDLVARAIARKMAEQGGRPVLLDARSIDDLEHHFPGFWALCAEHGLDPSAEPVPVTPAAHYWMGGIDVDVDGRSGIRNLYAIGEAARTGAHGANRLASNSLLEALVFGYRAAQAVGEPWSRAVEQGSAAVQEDGALPVVDRVELQKLMWRCAGLERTAEGLAEAATTLAGWRGATATIAELETANLLLLARALVAAAAARPESLGAHFRADADLTPNTEREAALAC